MLRKAAVLGGTGSVGQHVIEDLLKRGWEEVVMISRRETGAFKQHVAAGRVREHVVDMSKGMDVLQAQCEEVMKREGTHALFMTLGVGAPRQATEEELRRVDVHIPTACARGARNCETVRHVGLLTAVNADASAAPGSSSRPPTSGGGWVYNQCKGQVEQNLREMGFNTASAFRPAALIGSPNTPGAVRVLFWFADPFVSWKLHSSHVREVAGAMVLDAERALAEDYEKREKGFVVYEGENLHMTYKEWRASG
eukprot:Hpha_TRINITY_DN8816_c0_g1::TRINITY_DN8816_c0_g1_i1::g.141315::m.141315